MNLVQLMNDRYSTKVFDPNKKIPTKDLEQIKEIIRLCPSSLNLQPWKVYMGTSDAFKASVIKSLHGNHTYNIEKVETCSHVLVFATKLEIDDKYISHLVQKELQDKRIENEALMQERKAIIKNYMKHHEAINDVSTYLSNQTYINVGNVLCSVKHLGIDAIALGGFDNVVLDQVLNLKEDGYTSTLIICLGYQSPSDFNAKLPKSRLNIDEVIKDMDGMKK